MCIRDRPRWALISSKRARVRLLSCSRWRNFNSVVASGTDWRDRSMPTKSRSAWLSYSASSSASSARPYHCCRQYMRSMVGTPIGWRPTRPLVGYSGSMTAISRAHGTMRSISPRNFSRRVRFFFIAYSALAKLRCDIGVLSLDSVLLRMHAPCRVRRIDQQFPRHFGVDIDVMRSRRREHRVLIYLVDREHESLGVLAWAMPKAVDEAIAAICRDQRTSAAMNLDHPGSGFDLELDWTGAELRDIKL